MRRGAHGHGVREVVRVARRLGKKPEDPEMLRAMDLFREAFGASEEKRVANAKEIWKIAVEQMWSIGTVGQSPAVMGVRIVKNNMGNVPDRTVNAQHARTPHRRCRSRTTSSEGLSGRRATGGRSFCGSPMVAYIVRRLLLAVLTVWAISVLSFIIIHLPPGDYVTSYIASMSRRAAPVSEGEAKALREQIGLDQRSPSSTRSGWASSCRQLRDGDGMGPAGRRRHRRPPVAHDDHLARRDHLHLGVALPIGIYSRCSATRSSTTCSRSSASSVSRFPASCSALDRHVRRLRISARTWAGSSRPITPRRRGAWARRGTSPSTCRSRRSCSASAGTRPAHPHHAVEPARRIAQALRDDGAGAGPAGVSASCFANPVRVALNPFNSTIGYLLPYIVSGSISCRSC
jgi:hypothetical protein